jgi:hypothetical protein
VRRAFETGLEEAGEGLFLAHGRNQCMKAGMEPSLP